MSAVLSRSAFESVGVASSDAELSVDELVPEAVVLA